MGTGKHQDEIRQLLDAAGIDATALQKRTGVSMREIARLARHGISRPGPDTLARIAKGLRIDPAFVAAAFEVVWRRAVATKGGAK